MKKSYYEFSEEAEEIWSEEDHRERWVTVENVVLEDADGKLWLGYKAYSHGDGDNHVWHNKEKQDWVECKAVEKTVVDYVPLKS